MKPLNRIPILCTASILYLFIIGRNFSTKQTLAAACHAGRGECGQVPPWNAIWNATRIAPWHPFSGFCWRYACLPVLTLGIQCPGDAVTSILPAGIRLGRESASLVRAVKDRPQGNPTPGLWRALSLSAIELYSVKMGKRRQIQILSTHCPESLLLRSWWPSYAMAVAKALHRLCASSPGSAWAFLGLLGLEREYDFRWAL